MGFNTFPCNPYPISTEELHKGDNEELQAQIDAIKDGSEIDSFGGVETALGVVTEAITGLGTSKAAKADIAPTFSAEGTYAVGDLVYYEGVLYKCTTAHEEAAWDAEDFTVTSVVEEVCAINSNITTVSTGSITAGENVTINSSDVKKFLNIVNIVISATLTPTLGSYNDVGVLQSGYRRADSQFFAAFNYTTKKPVLCLVDKYGGVYLYPTSDDSSAVSTEFKINAMYFV